MRALINFISVVLIPFIVLHFQVIIHDSRQSYNRTLKISTTKRQHHGEDRVEEVATNSSSFHQVFSKSVKYGAQYTFWVKTDVQNSALAGPVTLKTVPIPAPSGLTHNQDYKNKVRHTIEMTGFILSKKRIMYRRNC